MLYNVLSVVMSIYQIGVQIISFEKKSFKHRSLINKNREIFEGTPCNQDEF